MTHTHREYGYTPWRNTMQTARAGFTLIEIMIAIAIVGILAAIVIPSYMAYQATAKKKAAQSTLRVFKQAIMLYDIDNNKIPTTLKDLVKPPADAKNWPKGGYLEKPEIPEDPWGGKYQYKPTPGGEHQYELYSYGPSGKAAPKNEWIDVWKS